MSLLIAMFLSTTVLASMSPEASSQPLLPTVQLLQNAPTSQQLDPATCITGWLQVGETLVSKGYARHTGISWQGGMPVPIPSAISADVCPALLDITKRLTFAGCRLERDAEITRQAAAQSNALYRQCQDRFPDTWDRTCLSYFTSDQQISQRYTYMLDVKSWIGSCAQQ